MIYKILITILILTLTACGGGGDSSGGGNNNQNLNAGVFIDLDINNLQYSTDGKVFKTTDNSKFYYSDDSPLKFYVDGIFIGELIPKEEVLFFEMVNSENKIFSDKFLNILTLLKTLDSNNRLDDGVDLSENNSQASLSYVVHSSKINIDDGIDINELHNTFVPKVRQKYGQAYNTNFNITNSCNNPYKYHSFDSRPLVITCSDHEVAFWLERYMWNLQSIANIGIYGKQEGSNDFQNQVNQLAYQMDGVKDIFASIKKESLSILTQFAKGVYKVAYANDIKYMEPHHADKVFSVLELLVISNKGNNISETDVVNAFKNISVALDLNDATTFLETYGGFIKHLKDLNFENSTLTKSRVLSIFLSVAKTTMMGAIEKSGLNDDTGGILENSVNGMWSAVESYTQCGSLDLVKCIEGIYDIFKNGFALPVWKATAEVWNSNIWSDSTEISNYLLKKKYALKYYLDRNFNMDLIEQDIEKNAKWYKPPIDWISRNAQLLYSSYSNQEYWDSLETEIEKISGSSFDIDEKDKVAIRDLIRDNDKLVTASKGILLFFQNKGKKIITIHYSNSFPQDIFPEHGNITCKLNGIKVMDNEEFTITPTYSGFNKEINYVQKKSSQNIRCQISIGRVFMFNAYNYEDVRSNFNFLDRGQTPSKPTLVSPGDPNSPGSILTNLKPTLSWNTINDATYYKVAVRDVNTDSLVVNKTNVVDTSLTAPSNLTAGHQYYWNITACNDAGCSPWAEPLYFQIKESQNTPSTPNTTGEYITHEVIVIYWDAVDNATKYQLELEDVSNGDIQTTEVTTESGGFTNLTSEHDYKIKVRAYNSNGYGDFSPYINFKTNKNIPDAPSLIIVKVEGLNAIIAWQEVDSADRYKVEVIDRDGSDNHSKYVSVNEIIISNLTAGHRYKVKIKARVNGNYGDYSNYEYFETEDVLPPPNKIYYSVVVPDVVLSWDSVTGAEKYGLQIDEINGNDYDKVKEVSTNQITFSNSELKGGRQYRIRVRSYVNGQYGGYSSYGSFDLCASRWLPSSLSYTLRKKDTYDSNVVKLQNFLSDLGASIVIDGYFGGNTYDAVKDYQSKHGLSSDGEVGTNTIRHMRTTCY